jgi:hypothetical protein
MTRRAPSIVTIVPPRTIKSTRVLLCCATVAGARKQAIKKMTNDKRIVLDMLENP